MENLKAETLLTTDFGICQEQEFERDKISEDVRIKAFKDVRGGHSVFDSKAVNIFNCH
jgi:hypothetical protein